MRLATAMREAAEVAGDVPAALTWAADVGQWAPRPGDGDTRSLWQLLANIAATDLGVARVLEPHLDALAILDQAGLTPNSVGADVASTWGVFAAEGPGVRLRARNELGEWRLNGVKPWCSLARDLTHALVTAQTADGTRRMFAVDLRSEGIVADEGPWFARGLNWIVSAPVHFENVRARPVGDPGWYFERPGFSWGGMGVAACWFGGATGLARALIRADAHGEPDQLALAQIGAVDIALHGARAALASAAALVDDPDVVAEEFGILAFRLRGLIAQTAETVLTRVGHDLGPAPLVGDEDHARRVADLQLYLRQHHAERDDAALGGALLGREEPPW